MGEWRFTSIPSTTVIEGSTYRLAGFAIVVAVREMNQLTCPLREHTTIVLDNLKGHILLRLIKAAAAIRQKALDKQGKRLFLVHGGGGRTTITSRTETVATAETAGALVTVGAAMAAASAVGGGATDAAAARASSRVVVINLVVGQFPRAFGVGYNSNDDKWGWQL